MTDHDRWLDEGLDEDDEFTEEELELIEQEMLDAYLENKQNEEDWADEFYSPNYPERDV